jgi:hypothetical protein
MNDDASVKMVKIKIQHTIMRFCFDMYSTVLTVNHFILSLDLHCPFQGWLSLTINPIPPWSCASIVRVQALQIRDYSQSI